MSNWATRKEIKGLRDENERLRAALQDLITYCDDEDRMGNFVYAVRYRAQKALDKRTPERV